MTNIQQSLEMETNQSLLHKESGNGLINNLKASKKTITDLNLVQDGASILHPGRRIHLRRQTGNQAATGSQLGLGFVANIILDRTVFFRVNPCSSTGRSQHQLVTQRKASRRTRTWSWTMSNFVLCWLHHCTYRSEKQVQNDRKFITLNVKTWCPVHLKIQ